MKQIFATLCLVCCLLTCYAFFFDAYTCQSLNHPQNYNHPYPPYHQDCYIRNEISEILDYLNYTVGVEIGVQKGHYSEETLKLWPKCKKYYLVDIWKKQGEFYTDTANVPDHLQDQNYLTAKRLMEKFGSVPTLVRNASVDAAARFPDEYFDYIYLDARHDYCGVMEDLEAWWPKLKVGGMMSGHDFLTAGGAKSLSRGSANFYYCLNGTYHEGAVKQAVDEFACRHKLAVLQSKDKPPSFYFSRKRAKGVEFVGSWK
jgi:hypothetical protein